jgi:hypothetical protein
MTQTQTGTVTDAGSPKITMQFKKFLYTSLKVRVWHAMNEHRAYVY